MVLKWGCAGAAAATITAQAISGILCLVFIGRKMNVLREFDDCGVTYIYSEAFDTPQMGQAIMNRLMKAAGQKKIQV